MTGIIKHGCGRPGLVARHGQASTWLPRARGFTLVEIALAMILVSLIMAIAVGAIRMSRQAAADGERRVEATNAIRVTQEFLRRQLARVLPLAYDVDTTAGQNIVFEGEDDAISFVAPMPGYLSNGGPYVQRLELRQGELRFHHRMLISDEQDQAEPVVLIDRIRRGRFEYRGIEDDGQLGDWRRDWEDPSRTPMMVRLDLEFDDASGLSWPSLEVPLLIDVGGVNNAYRFFGPSDEQGMPPPPGSAEERLRRFQETMDPGEGQINPIVDSFLGGRRSGR
ncbi:MAG: prepilin-type N-terminal cleavage/methylation domain-containing protein [Xanthomonadales bacterium]|nr:prepilin-type N-terminal cleavage/methylation domain-containing protein [Xanthomonadales bacterium]